MGFIHDSKRSGMIGFLKINRVQSWYQPVRRAFQYTEVTFKPQSVGPWYPCVRLSSTRFDAAALSIAISTFTLPATSNLNSLGAIVLGDIRIFNSTINNKDGY